VAAQQQDRAVVRAEHGPGLLGRDRLDVHTRDGHDRLVQAADEPAHEVVVRALHRLGVNAPPESGRPPEAQAGDDRRHVPGRAGEDDHRGAQRAPASEDRRGDQREE
jgi:hypothetical protein